MGALLAVVGLGLVIGLVVVPWALSARRVPDAPTVAERAGLAYSAADPFGCTRVAFPLFRKGDGQVVENVMWREGAPLASRVFDFAYYEINPDRYHQDQRTYRHFSCAMVQVDGGWPDLSIGPNGLVEKVFDLVGMGAIDLESDEFNRRFALRCDDRRFAVALCDPSMIDFLLASTSEIAFALKGRWALVTSDPASADLLPALLGLAERFRDQIPRVVYELYPSPFHDAHGNPLPIGDEGPAPTAGDDPPADDRPEYDLDGKLLPRVPEDPWGQHPRTPPGDEPN